VGNKVDNKCGKPASSSDAINFNTSLTIVARNTTKIHTVSLIPQILKEEEKT